MKKTIKPSQVRQQLGDLLDQVSSQKEEFVIERRGKAMAALVSVDKLRRIERAAELELLEALDEHARRLTLEQVDELANTAKHRARPPRKRSSRIPPAKKKARKKARTASPARAKVVGTKKTPSRGPGSSKGAALGKPTSRDKKRR